MAGEATVFVVDDDPAIRDSLAVLLEAQGIQSKCFDSGAAFLAQVGPSDRGCALIDVRMPGMDGLEVQQHLARSKLSLPVIIMTGHAEVPIAVKAMKAGALDFIEKPFEFDALLAAIRHGFAASMTSPSALIEPAEARARIGRLTAREQEIFRLLALGKPNKTIAFELGISPRTVEVHRARVMEKLEARSVSDLVRLALAAG